MESRNSNVSMLRLVMMAAFASLCLLPPEVSQGQVNLLPHAGWKAFAVVTQGDDISDIADEGYGSSATRGTYDGLGVFRNGSELTFWLNHETSSAAISRVEVDSLKFRTAIQSTIDNGMTPFPSSLKTGMGYAYDSIYDGTYHAVNNPNPIATGTIAVGNYGNANFDRFCSGTSYRANSFGSDRGFADRLYLTGEEVSGGKFYALDQDARSLWEVPDFGGSPLGKRCFD